MESIIAAGLRKRISQNREGNIGAWTHLPPFIGHIT